VPDVFEAESDSAGRLTDAFQKLLESQAEAARRSHAALPVVIARPSKPASHPGPFLCEQNPFETTHILANGDVVPCEVLDRRPLGNLRHQPFERIWHGAVYDQFRHGYITDRIPECATCMFRAPVIEVGCVRTSWGWHPADDSGTLWSRAEASFTCEPRGYPAMWLRGLLPSAPGGNTIHFRRECGSVVSFHHQGSEPVQFEVVLPLDADRDCETFTASVDHAYSPWRHGMNGDTRQLGFAIFSAGRGGEGRISQTIRGAPGVALRTGARILLEAIRAPIVPSPPDPPIAPPHDSLAVLIPERDHPAMLASCLAHLGVALGPLDLPFEVIVIANASERRDYAALQAEHPHTRFLFYPSPLGFTAAIRHGLRYVTAGWTYLLNNDVRLHQEALNTILQQRAPRIFSLASRICMDSTSSDRETNRTALRFVDGLVHLTELDPAASGGHLYSGGGCSLFQTAWLRRLHGRPPATIRFIGKTSSGGCALARRASRIASSPGRWPVTPEKRQCAASMLPKKLRASLSGIASSFNCAAFLVNPAPRYSTASPPRLPRRSTSGPNRAVCVRCGTLARGFNPALVRQVVDERIVRDRAGFNGHPDSIPAVNLLMQ